MPHLAIGRYAQRVVSAGLDENHSGNLCRIGGSIETNQPAAIGMTHKHKGWFHAALVQQRVKLIDNLTQGARMRPEVAPSVARAVIRTDAREFGDVRLDQAPLHREITDARFEYHGRLRSAGFACAIEMQS